MGRYSGKYNHNRCDRRSASSSNHRGTPAICKTTYVFARFAPHLSVGAASPATYVPPAYGHPDLSPISDVSPTLTLEQKLTLQEIVGSLLYYARGIDVTILKAVNHLASTQANPTVTEMLAATRLLAYCSRYPNNALRYHACDMILHIQFDASYLSRPGARSVAGGIFYLGNVGQPTIINGAIHAINSILSFHQLSRRWLKPNTQRCSSMVKKENGFAIYSCHLDIRYHPLSFYVTTNSHTALPLSPSTCPTFR